MSKARFDTLALYAGAAPDPATGAYAMPIHLSTSFIFRDNEHVTSLFSMERAGHVYSCISNPTVTVFEERMAALENGVGAIVAAPGQAALHLAIATLMGVGSHIVASSALYGGSHNLLHYTLRRFGVETTFVKPGDIDDWCSAIRPNTQLLFDETPGNPGLDVLDILTTASIAHDAGVPLLVDSTFITPWLLQPSAHGADLVYHSATKSLGGHGTTIGGVLVGGDTFDYVAVGKHPELTEPYAGFHDMVFAGESTIAPFLLRARRKGLCDFGTCMNPMAARQLLQGIETLPLRMTRHVDNARRIVALLASHPMVASIVCPELESHPDHVLAKRLPPRGCGAVFSFDLRSDRRTGQQFIESLGLLSHLANVGDARSLVIHPASTTHFRMGADVLAAADISGGTIHLSIGLENVDDLIDDLKRGLKVVECAMPATSGKADANATRAR